MKVLDNYQCEGQITIFEILNPDTWCGKTYQEPLVQTKERTLGAYLRKFAELKIKPPQFLYLKRENGAQADVLWGGKVEIYTHWLGEYTMHSFGEYPNEERESRLSQILEENPHPKYSLSEKACQGILNRADRRGKALPTILREALEKQALSKNEPENLGGAKESSYRTREQEPCQQSTISICIGGGQSNDAATPSVEVSKTLNCMDDPMKVFCLQGNGIDRADTAGCNGKGWRENQSYTLNTIDRPAICVSQDAYDKYTENEKSASIKQSGGNIGGGQRDISDTVGALCACDYKGAGNQYVNDGKCIVQMLSENGSSE